MYKRQLQQFDLQATLDGSFVVFFETGRVLDGIFGLDVYKRQVFILGIMALVSFLLIDRLYKQRGE